MFINDIFNDKDKSLNEVSNELLGRYKKAAGADATAADKRGDIEHGNKRFKGIVKATVKQGENDTKKHKEKNVKEQTAVQQYNPKGVPLKQTPPPLNVPQGWEAKTQADGSTRISKQGSMSSAEYKQNMADYKAQNWTPEKMADYGQRMASGQGYTDAERAANYQQQQKSFGQYADQPVQEGISVVDTDYDLDQMVLTLDIEGQRKQFTYWDYDENFENAERKDVFDQLQDQPWYASLDHPTKMEILDAAYKAIRGEEPSEYRPTVGDEPLDEAGPFSYGAKKPRKGSVADLAAKKRKEQEKDYKPIEPRDQMVGVAKILPKDVSEGKEDLSKYSTERLQAYVKKVSGGGVPAFGSGAQLKRVQQELKRREQGVAEGFGDMVKGIKRKIAGKEDPTDVQDRYARAARREIGDANKYNNPAANRDSDQAVNRYKKVSKVVNKEGVAEGSVQDKLHQRHQQLRKKSGLPDPDYYKELKATYDLPDQERYAKAAELKKKYQVKEARKPEVNFDVEDLKKLERIRDLPTLKTLAFELISKPSERPMKPEKVEWFRSALERMDSPLKVIKLMYDLLLSGEGHAVIGSKNSMKSNTYRDRFGESTDGSVKYEFTLADGKKDYQTSKPANPGEKVKVDPKSAATIYQMNNPLRKIKSVKVVDEPKEEKSQVTNEDVERYIEELERAGYNILEEKTRLDPKCWKGYRKAGTKMKGDVRVNNCVPIKKKVDEYGAANGPPNLNKSDIKRMMPQQPVAEQIPTITDTGPREQPHPAAQALGLVRGLKKLSGIDKSDVENAVNQEITNIVRSPHDPSSENVSIINRLFGPRR